MQIHRAGPDGAAAGHGYAGFAEPGQQRAEHEHRGAHGFDQFIGGFRAERAGGHGDLPVFKGVRAAEQFKEFEGGTDIPQIRDIGVGHGFVEQDAAHEDGESRVFGAAHMHDAGQRNAAFDDQFVHELSLYVGPEKPGVAGWMEDAPREGGTLARSVCGS